MSNETVEVPIEALQELKNSIVSRTSDGRGYELTTLLDHTLQRILNYIPKPPKVGDAINGYQFAELPPRSVAIDGDGDVWVSTGDDSAILIEKTSIYASHDDIVASDTYLAQDLPGFSTLVHIGTIEEDN